MEEITKEHRINDLNELKKVMESSAMEPLVNGLDINEEIENIKNDPNLSN